ncbi:hypothetical protein H4F99_06360 [Lysobacter sp. SG-8]|uniref:Uncharacterized protein n=1 Tax=Marilutibacter penaei TaxID=2759900 RepID=A0A7W3YEA8_9GAMM|nr:hypothetical protein [Lysobacter penaei]MBB1088110.1 hypothetical protein [Lysobacter penaei]
MPFASLPTFVDRRARRHLLIQVVLAFAIGMAWQAVEGGGAPGTTQHIEAHAAVWATGAGDEAPPRAPEAPDPVKKSRRHLVSLVDVPLPPPTGYVLVDDGSSASTRDNVGDLPMEGDAYRAPSPAAEVRFLPLRGQPPPARA